MKTGLFTLGMVMALNCFSQSSLNIQYAKNIGISGAHTINYNMDVDLNGNTIVGGRLDGCGEDFDPSSAVHTLCAPGAYMAYLAKYDSTGNYIWALQLSGPTAHIKSIKTDQLGNIYVGGEFEGTVNFNPLGTAVIVNSVSGGSFDSFIAKYSSAGQLIWVRPMGGDGWEEVFSICVDNSNNVYIAGYFDSSVLNFNATNSVARSGSRDGFIAKYDPYGAFKWSHTIYSPANYTSLSGVAADQNGNVFLTGYWNQGTLQINGAVSVPTINAVGYSNGFFAKLDGNGNYLFEKALLPATASDYVNTGSIEVSANGNLYLIASCNAADMNPGTAVNLKSGTCLTKYDGNGNYLWSNEVASGVYNDKVFALDNQENSYVIGEFYYTLDFDPSAGTCYMSPIASAICGDDACLTKFDANGSFVYAKQFGGVSSDNFSYSVRVNSQNQVCIAGSFFETTDFDPGSGVSNLTAHNSTCYYDLVIAKYSQAIATGVEQISKPIQITVYPNPVQNQLRIYSGSLIQQVSVSDANGNLLFENSGILSTEAALNFENRASGIYFVSVKTDAGTTVQKVIRE